MIRAARRPQREGAAPRCDVVGVARERFGFWSALLEVALGADAAPDGTVVVDVKDQGPGIPAAALERGRSDRGSTGLGLDIARACAEATRGGLSVRSDGEWSVVRLVLGTGWSEV